ncbi:hypothetical protein Tco_1346723 [Tanacetum coccineum]
MRLLGNNLMCLGDESLDAVVLAKSDALCMYSYLGGFWQDKSLLFHSRVILSLPLPELLNADFLQGYSYLGVNVRLLASLAIAAMSGIAVYGMVELVRHSVIMSETRNVVSDLSRDLSVARVHEGLHCLILDGADVNTGLHLPPPHLSDHHSYGSLKLVGDTNEIWVAESFTGRNSIEEDSFFPHSVDHYMKRTFDVQELWNQSGVISSVAPTLLCTTLVMQCREQRKYCWDMEMNLARVKSGSDWDLLDLDIRAEHLECVKSTPLRVNLLHKRTRTFRSVHLNKIALRDLLALVFSDETDNAASLSTMAVTAKLELLKETPRWSFIKSENSGEAGSSSRAEESIDLLGEEITIPKGCEESEKR